MHPFYFGESGRQLYGVYDTPKTSDFANTGVLLCYPMAQEYMRSHWAFRQLVSQLSRAGMHCMRFDYYGSGDSAGTAVDADIGQWLTDVSTGLTEFKDISGVAKVSLVGLRLGAAIAATVPVDNHRISKLILWDPVVSGSVYINSLREMQKSLQGRLQHLYKNRKPRQLQGIEEFLGFSYSDSMIAQIEALDLLQMTRFSSSDIYLFVSEQREEYELLKQHLQSLDVLGGFQVTSTPGEWDNLYEIENALIASDMITAISNELNDK